ncbi:hypothetical protein ABC383_15015 [Noviherbaspirillum sp. 1P10PC]|uniref:hypothetical protein n=1 Tax=Noviherbaspirillum sp. 1P10PC TaxID=3132292 RepID=UPI0039A10735
MAKQKSNPAAGTDSRLVSTAVQSPCVTRQGTGSTVVVDVDVRIETSNFKLQTSNFKLQTSNFKLQTSNFKLQTSNFKLQKPTAASQ